MIFHVDANSFYASCERLFRPDLKDKPIAVLSNNDGIIIALTSECKELGLKRGDVYFKVKDFCSRKDVSVFSSNYTLYADISFRLNSIYALFAEHLEIYSIDESFLYIPELKNFNLTDFGFYLKQLIWEQTGIPVSVGIAPTKTLAKLCNKLAKKNGGVFNWNECNQNETLQNYKVEDIWGIGPAKAHDLKRHGIYNAYSLKQMDKAKAKKMLTITGFNTVMELNGITAISQVIRPLSKNICSSRSFQGCVYELAELEEALSYFCTIAVKKMREENQCCKMIYITIGTAFPFEKEFDPRIHYFNGAAVKLPHPTSYLPEILEKSLELLHSIYRPYFGYRKASVNLLDLAPVDLSPELFETPQSIHEKNLEKVMSAVDKVNLHFGKETVTIGTGLSSPTAASEKWHLKRDLKSPDYTTDIQGLPVAE